jgi:hypothetical protein
MALFIHDTLPAHWRLPGTNINAACHEESAHIEQLVSSASTLRSNCWWLAESNPARVLGLYPVLHLRLERAERLVTARLERGEPLMRRVGGRAQVLQPWEPWTSCWEETNS